MDSNIEVKEFNKSQNIRLIDMFLLGPFMIWAGTNMESKVAGKIMVASGIATILYNGKNYYLNKDISN